MNNARALVKRNATLYLFILPMTLLVLVFGIIPIFQSILMAFTKSSTSLSAHPVYVGLANFITIFKDSYFIDSFRITVLFTLISVPLNLFVALVLALLIGSSLMGKGSVVFKLAVFMPVVVPIMASSVVWKWMYNANYGAVNAVLTGMGLPAFSGLSSSSTVLFALGLVELWKHVGLYTIIFVTNLQLIDHELYEAAYLDGAGYLARTLHITLPELWPALSLNVVYALIQFLKTFAVSLVMTQGGPNYASNFVSYYAYSKFKIGDYGEAAAMGTVLFVTVIILTLTTRSFVSAERMEGGNT
jgi:ABC-type sugar transport system permease subunit